MTIRVLICDDHPVFRRGLAMLLADVEDLTVVGEAADGDEALAMVGAARPDVVVLDLNMPGPSGVETTRRLLAGRPDIKILVLTMFDEDHLVLASLKAGARGFLMKGASAEQVTAAIRTVAAGEMVLAGTVATRLPGMLEAGSRTRFPQLTDREEEILGHVAAGASNLEISRALYLSEKTVRNYVSAVATKLGAPSRAALVAIARDAAGS